MQWWGFSPVCLLMWTTSMYWALKGFSSLEHPFHWQTKNFLLHPMCSLFKCWKRNDRWSNYFLGVIPPDDWWSRGREFESLPQIQDWSFFTFLCCYKRQKVNEKRPGMVEKQTHNLAMLRLFPKPTNPALPTWCKSFATTSIWINHFR